VKSTHMNIALRASAASVAMGLALASMPAFAQDALPDDSADIEQIVVTGSRIARPELTSPSPVSVVSA
jgi:iron complex outermembrane receptor protein